MRPVIIGAGRGSRLGPETEEIPKALVPVMGRPMLEWIFEALAEAGFSRRDVIYIAGYRAEVVRARYPELTYVMNEGWASNNILLSLLCAREHLTSGFLCSYADIVYRGQIVRALSASPHAMTLGCDTDWRRRYVDRSQHPESDAEKMLAEGDRVLRLSRLIPPAEASGEFVGVARFTADGAAELLEAFDRAREAHDGGTFREGRTFQRAYLIDLLQWMIEGGHVFHRASMHGGYMEIDTLEDLACAERWWKDSPPENA
jgi:choline kinase